jgi:hypothetical protein
MDNWYIHHGQSIIVNKFVDEFLEIYTSRTIGIYITDNWYIHHGQLVYTSRTKTPHEAL